jgi:branched-chain amino acid transport system ATP-binding protein
VLTLEKVTAGYHRLQILHEISIEVNEGEIVSIVGANGAGKTTTLNTIAGLVKPTSGSITSAGKPAGGRRPSDLVQEGLVLVPEGRALFGNLSVEENLQMGGWSRDRADLTGSMDDVFELFPILRERRAQVAETFSGGQQQMLAIGRALMAKPKLLMLDEPSTGLSPKLTWAVLDAIKRIRDTGVAVLLVEQNASQALAMADRAYVLESGSVVLEGPGPQLAQDDRVRAAYLGM